MTNLPPEPSPQVFGKDAFNVPNIITFSRLILTFILLIMIDMGDLWIACTIIFTIAVTTDFVDGYLARLWNQVTVLGRIMDPFVDKIIIGGTLIFLTNIEGSGICSWITFIVIGREMFITGLRSVLEGHGVDFSAQWSGKLKMVIQSITIPVCLLGLSSEFSDSIGEQMVNFQFVRDCLLWATAAITIYSGAEYTWRGFHLLGLQVTTASTDVESTDS